LASNAQQIRYLGQNEGLNSRQTFNTVQDKKGFIWISTRFGVDRFDGEFIKNYPMNILYNGTNPIRVTQVVLDRDSSLWVYTDRGTIYKYHQQRDEFICVTDIKRYLKSLYFDHQNNIWIGARSYIGVIENDSLNLIEDPLLKNEEVRSIQGLDTECLLVATNKNLYKLNYKNRKLKPLIDWENLNDKDFFIETCFFDEIEKCFWIGLQNKGLFIYNLDNKTLEQINDTRLMFHPILSIVPYDDSSLLLGTEGLGMCTLNKKTKKIDRIYSNWSEKKYRISGDAVYGIYKDKEDQVWLSTFSNGVSILDFKDYGFKSITHEENNRNSLVHNTVCDVLEDSDKNVWFATSNGLSFWNRKTNTWKTYLDSKNIITLFEDSRGEIWVAAYSSGIYVLNKKGEILRQFTHQSNDKKTIATNFVYTISEDINGNMWTGGKKGHVSRYDRKTNTFRSIPVSQANYILPWGDKKMIISSEWGVYAAPIDSTYAKSTVFSKNLKSFYVNDMHLESDSIIWLATYGDGINRCNLYTGEVQSFTQENGFSLNIIYALLPDDGNNLWFSSENGLGKFNMLTHSVTNFSKADGISGNRFRQLSRTKTSDGYFIFGSYNGAIYFKPEDIVSKESYAKISLQEFKLFNQVVKPEDKDSPLTLSLDNTSHINLSYKQHSFSIDFTAVDFSIRENRLFMWKLEGLDKDWLGPTSEHIANYTNLTPNDYVFKVKYLDDNNQVLDERSVGITVAPPFWNTTWARILQILVLLGIAYSIYWYIRQRIKKKQSEEKIKFFINTAHDIRTPLTLISSPLFELKEEIEPTKKNTYLLKLITDNLDKLNKMFSQLLDFQKAYESQDQLIVRERDINKYLDEKALYWKSSALKKKINLNLHQSSQNVVEWVDIEKLDKILDNLVSNAIKYTHENGKIDVWLTADANSWKIAVIDNGIGISKSDRKNLFRRFYRASNAMNSQESGSGLGLLLVKKYVTLHRGDIKVVSSENKGSEFYIQFKRGKDHYLDNIKLDDQNLPIMDEKTMDNEQQDIDKMKVKVLIVEDNNDLRTYIELSLSHYYHIYTAKNGAEAWDNIMKINPDIVVSDLQMPEMDGFGLCDKIKNTFETSHIPVILLTVVNDKENVTRGFNLGVDDYIEKPFDVKYLRIKIDNIIQNRKILRLKFLGIDKSASNDNIAENDFNTEFIKKATDIIEANISNTGFSISDFSKELGLSRTLLYNKFNAITGYTPNDFIKIVRMNKAILHFREKKYSINEVAFMVGFDEPAYFSTCFKKIYGKTPKQFIDENIK